MDKQKPFTGKTYKSCRNTVFIAIVGILAFACFNIVWIGMGLTWEVIRPKYTLSQESIQATAAYFAEAAWNCDAVSTALDPVVQTGVIDIYLERYTTGITLDNLSQIQSTRMENVVFDRTRYRVIDAVAPVTHPAVVYTIYLRFGFEHSRLIVCAEEQRALNVLVTDQSPSNLIFDPNGEIFIVINGTTREARRANVFNATTLEEIQIPLLRGTDIAFHPYEPLLATITPNKLSIWNYETWERLIQFRNPDDTFRGLYFNEQGTAIIQFATNDGFESFNVQENYPVFVWGIPSATN